MTTDRAAPDRAGRSPEDAAGAFAGRLFEASIGAFDILSIYLGDRLGLYAALARDGAATSLELAERAAIDRRYAQEWLEQQAATGILAVDDAAAPADARRYSLSEGHALALIDPLSPFSMVPVARSIVACARVLPQLMGAFRSGGGVAWSDYGPDMIEAQGDFNRPWLIGSLGTTYLPGVPDVHARLQADPPARVADVACGVGWAAISIAQAYPRVRVDGFDLDAGSIEHARRNASDAGVSDRVTFAVRDAGDPGAAGQYDLAVVIEAIHDLSRPVEALAAICQMLRPGGTAIVADERTGEAFSAPAGPAERLFYGFSVFCCLPAAQADPPSAGTGAVMRADTLRRYGEAAGFARVSILDLEHDMLRFYRLDP
ncbi:MAG: SAM-dependent methyltransferase [Candidatus Limnocylindrales bacterium]